DVVVVNSLERLSRKLAHQVILAELLAEKNVTIESVTENLGDSSPIGQMMRAVISAAGEIEYARFRERVERGRKGRLEKNWLLGVGAASYGYKWADENKTKWLINNDPVRVDTNGREWSEIEIYFRIVEMAEQGTSLRQIALTLIREGLTNRRGENWTPTALHFILDNIAYTGKAIQQKYRYQKQPDGRKLKTKRPPEEQIVLPDGVIPAVISIEQYENLQRKLADNKRLASRNNDNPEDTLLRAGLVVCGLCGSNMYVSRSVDNNPRLLKPRNRIRYCCRTINSGSYEIQLSLYPELERHYLTVESYKLDEAAWQRAKEIIHDPEQVKPHVEAKREQLGNNPAAKHLGVTNERITKLDQSIKNLDRQITRLSEKTPEDETEAQEIDDAIDSMNQRKAEIRKEKNDLEKERLSLLSEQDYWLAMQDAVEKFEVWCNEWRGKLDTVSYKEKRYILEFLSIRVVVRKDEHHSSFKVESEPLLNCVPRSFRHFALPT
ncbi:MAG: recombinase family protein, partial [Ktedonobacteraceae bacterium]|nr:recombinase family protein [Ktedonobacteraceae bacterium]